MNTLSHHLLSFSNKTPNKTVFRNLFNEGKQSQLTYSELVRSSWNTSKQINTPNRNDGVLLLFSDALEFISAFISCQMAGKIAIPMFFPKNRRYFERLRTIIDNSKCEIALCSEDDLEKVSKGFKAANIQLKITPVSVDSKDYGDQILLKHNDLSFLQYTSGSTGNPKGVKISQANLIHNQKLLKETFGCGENSIILTWLPFYHDMGLIGNMLHTIYTGSTCLLMSGPEVLQNPAKWLKAIGDHKVTHSGGPNFIYDKCFSDVTEDQAATFNLTSWKVAYNGSEPVRTETIKKFIHKFKPSGFSQDAYQTCYGLAEATLLVAAGKPTYETKNVSSGRICADIDLIFKNDADDTFNSTTGEICIHGESVTEGYWGKDNDDTFIIYQGKKYLRTGDSGTLIDGDLYVNGRLKEMIIIKGKNIYPYDLELEIAAQVHAIENNGVVVTSIEGNAGEKVIVFAEIKRTENDSDLAKVVQEINKALLQTIGENAADVVLVQSRNLPRTSSGKLQRVLIRGQYLNNEIKSLITAEPNSDNDSRLRSLALEIESGSLNNSELLRTYLELLISVKLAIPENDINGRTSLLDIGVSSLSGVEIVHELNKALKINMDINLLLELNEMEPILDHISNLLWLKTQSSEGEEIVI